MAVFGGWRLTRTGALFVIGILVLGGLVTGGIFYVKNHGEAVRHEEAVKIAEENLKNQSEVKTQPVDTVDSSDKTETTSPDEAVKVVVEQTQPEVLPETGPESISNLLIIAILALSVSFYVASRRTTSHL